VRTVLNVCGTHSYPFTGLTSFNFYIPRTSNSPGIAQAGGLLVARYFFEVAIMKKEPSPREPGQHNVTVSDDGTVHLYLPGKEYKSRRVIGKIVGDVFHCERQEKDVFRALNAIGFNYELIRYFEFDKVIVHMSGTESLVTTRRHILRVGEVRYFKRNDLEPQIFLPLDDFGLAKAQEAEELDRRKRDQEEAESIQMNLELETPEHPVATEVSDEVV